MSDGDIIALAGQMMIPTAKKSTFDLMVEISRLLPRNSVRGRRQRSQSSKEDNSRPNQGTGPQRPVVMDRQRDPSVEYGIPSNPPHNQAPDEDELTEIESDDSGSESESQEEDLEEIAQELEDLANDREEEPKRGRRSEVRARARREEAKKQRAEVKRAQRAAATEARRRETEERKEALRVAKEAESKERAMTPRRNAGKLAKQERELREWEERLVARETALRTANPSQAPSQPATQAVTQSTASMMLESLTRSGESIRPNQTFTTTPPVPAVNPVCPVCQAPNPADAVWCNKCASRISARRCPNLACNRPEQISGTYCCYCKHPMQSATPVITPTTLPATYTQLGLTSTQSGQIKKSDLYSGTESRGDTVIKGNTPITVVHSKIATLIGEGRYVDLADLTIGTLALDTEETKTKTAPVERLITTAAAWANAFGTLIDIAAHLQLLDTVADWKLYSNRVLSYASSPSHSWMDIATYDMIMRKEKGRLGSRAFSDWDYMLFQQAKDIQSQARLGRDKTRRSRQDDISSSSAHRSPRKRDEACHRFNEGGCSRPKCRFRHFCKLCKSEGHGASACSGKTRKPE
jgi:hypothetical protein